MYRISVCYSWLKILYYKIFRCNIINYSITNKYQKKNLEVPPPTRILKIWYSEDIESNTTE